MRTRLGLLALLSATVLAGCPADNNTNNNNGGGKDMTVVRDLTGGGGDDGGAPEDLRRRRDLVDPGDGGPIDDGDMTVVGGDTDMTVVGGDTDMTVVGGDTDMTVVGGDTDMTVVGGDTDLASTGADLLPGGSTDLFNADLFNADMTPPPACGTTPTLDVKSMTVSNLAWSATGSDTFKMPLGFTVSGTVTLTDGAVLESNFNSGRVQLVNRFTGQSYFANTGTASSLGGPNLTYAYSMVVPPGEYFVASRFAFVWDDGASDAQMVVYRTEPDFITVCPALAATPTTANAVHAAVPTLVERTIEVTGLAGAYSTTTVDPDPSNNRLFYGGLYLESTDGRILFYKDDSGYTSNQNTVQFLNWPLPNSATGFVVQPTFSPVLLSTTNNGYLGHSFRFDSTKNITFTGTTDSNAFSALSITAGDLIKISGTVNDTSGRLFKPWTGFMSEYGYIEHAANCHQIVPSNDPYIRPTNTGDLYTDNPGFAFPVKKDASCEFFGGFRVRLPLTTNQGAPGVPANIANVSQNDIFYLISPTETLTAAANTTRNFTIPNLSGDVKRTLVIQTNAGVPIAGAVLQAEVSSLTDFPTFGGRSDNVATASVTGQAELNLLKGNYFLTVEAP